VFVDGVPAGQGNLRRNRSGGLYESSHHTRPWRYALAAAVAEELAGAPLLTDGVELACRFQFVRPLSHLRKSGELAKGAPRLMVRNPDLDKLARAVLDALTGVLYHDDAQVTGLHLTKVYDARAGLKITWPDAMEPMP
jgi:crossover junction endodeoxyribonuclease RusA